MIKPRIKEFFDRWTVKIKGKKEEGKKLMLTKIVLPKKIVAKPREKLNESLSLNLLFRIDSFLKVTMEGTNGVNSHQSLILLRKPQNTPVKDPECGTR